MKLDQDTFPDYRFIDCVTRFDLNEDGKLTQEERQNVYEISVDYYGIYDLEGIGYFPNIQYLSCNYNNLFTLDLSKNAKLELLSCRSNQLTSLNVSGCTKLKEMSCNSNQLTSLDVNKFKALTELKCSENKLKWLRLRLRGE